MAATVTLALGLSADVYVVIAKIAGSASVGSAAATTSLVLLIGLWHITPLMLRSQTAS
jgi:hypothetical protein